MRVKVRLSRGIRQDDRIYMLYTSATWVPVVGQGFRIQIILPRDPEEVTEGQTHVEREGISSMVQFVETILVIGPKCSYVDYVAVLRDLVAQSDEEHDQLAEQLEASGFKVVDAEGTAAKSCKS